MSKPANTKILPFAGRVELVRQAVRQRTQAQKPSNPYKLRADLWCAWLRREVLV